MKTKNTHGGKREGSGRPQNEVKRTNRSFRLSDQEYIKVKEYISETLRKV